MKPLLLIFATLTELNMIIYISQQMFPELTHIFQRVLDERMVHATKEGRVHNPLVNQRIEISLKNHVTVRYILKYIKMPGNEL